MQRQAEGRKRNDDLKKLMSEIERKRQDLEKIQQALAQSKDHSEEQEQTARLKAKLVEAKKTLQRL